MNNITSLKDVKTEENIKYFNMIKKTRNNSKFSSSNSKNKYKNRTKKNYSLSNSKNYSKPKSDKNRVIQMQSNRYKSYANKSKINKINDLKIKITEKSIKLEDKKEEIDFDCPEEMHYFMVNLTMNYKYLTENF